MGRQRSLIGPDARARQHAELAQEVLDAHPLPDDDHPPAPDWLAPSGEFADERPAGLAVPFCARDHCPWFRPRIVVSAELLVLHNVRTAAVPAARCSREARRWTGDSLTLEAYRGVLPARLPVCWPALRLSE